MSNETSNRDISTRRFGGSFCHAHDAETINSSVDSTNLRVSDRVGSSEQ